MRPPRGWCSVGWYRSPRESASSSRHRCDHHAGHVDRGTGPRAVLAGDGPDREAAYTGPDQPRHQVGVSPPLTAASGPPAGSGWCGRSCSPAVGQAARRAAGDHRLQAGQVDRVPPGMVGVQGGIEAVEKPRHHRLAFISQARLTVDLEVAVHEAVGQALRAELIKSAPRSKIQPRPPKLSSRVRSTAYTGTSVAPIEVSGKLGEKCPSSGSTPSSSRSAPPSAAAWASRGVRRRRGARSARTGPARPGVAMVIVAPEDVVMRARARRCTPPAGHRAADPTTVSASSRPSPTGGCGSSSGPRVAASSGWSPRTSRTPCWSRNGLVAPVPRLRPPRAARPLHPPRPRRPRPHLGLRARRHLGGPRRRSEPADRASGAVPRHGRRP